MGSGLEDEGEDLPVARPSSKVDVGDDWDSSSVDNEASFTDALRVVIASDCGEPFEVVVEVLAGCGLDEGRLRFGGS